MTKSILVTTSNEFHICHNIDGSDISELIGSRTGMFDIVGLAEPLEDAIMFVDDTGILDGREINIFASVISGRTIAGDVVLTGDEDDDGNLTDAPEMMFSDEFKKHWGAFVQSRPDLVALLNIALHKMDKTPKVVSLDQWLAQ